MIVRRGWVLLFRQELIEIDRLLDEANAVFGRGPFGIRAREMIVGKEALRVEEQRRLGKMSHPGSRIRRLADLRQDLAQVVFDVSLDRELTTGN